MTLTETYSKLMESVIGNTYFEDNTFLYSDEDYIYWSDLNGIIYGKISKLDKSIILYPASYKSIRIIELLFKLNINYLSKLKK